MASGNNRNPSGTGMHGTNTTTFPVTSVKVPQQGAQPKVTVVPARHRQAETGGKK